MKTTQGYFCLAISELRALWPCYYNKTIFMSYRRGDVELASLTVDSNGPDEIVLRYGCDRFAETTQTIRLECTPCHYGGERRWFICPGCGKRKAVLFFCVYFFCRSCLGLTYASQTEDSSDRLLSRIVKRRQRLGGRGSLAEAFPAKPKRMRWRTYLASWARDQQECARYFSNTIPDFQSIIPADNNQ